MKYPDIEVQLSGTDGNAFSILGKVRTALKKARVPYEKLEEFIKEACSGDYDRVLITCMEWVNVS